MKNKLYAFLLIALPSIVCAQNLQNRKVINDFSKSYCISRLTSGDDLAKSVMKAGITTSEVCGCVEKEMKYLVSDNDVDRFYSALSELTKAKGEKSNATVEKAWDDLEKLELVALQSCLFKLKK